MRRWLLGSLASTFSDGAAAPESWELENCVPSWVPLLCPRGEPVSPPGSGALTLPVVTAGLVWDQRGSQSSAFLELLVLRA